MFLLRAAFICIWITIASLSTSAAISTPLFQAQTARDKSGSLNAENALNGGNVVAQSADLNETAEIDQLLKECGDFIRKGRFADLTTKANEVPAFLQQLINFGG